MTPKLSTRAPKRERSKVRSSHTQRILIFVLDAGETRNQEENKEAKAPYQHKPRKLYTKVNMEITLDTVVPDLPKKNELIPKPDDEAFQNELDKIQKDIDECYKKMVFDDYRRSN